MIDLITANSKYSVSIGSSDTWLALVSTILIRVKDVKARYPYAYAFLKSGNCSAKNGLIAAREMNYIRDELASINPDDIVYDADDLTKQPPWGKDISPVITSCANYFTTADGKDLLAEIVCILTCGYYSRVDIMMQ